VGDLRRLSDAEWRALEIPAICRLYLKFLVRQAGRGGQPGPAPLASGSNALVTPPSNKPETFIEKLQNDFNYGLPFDMSLYNNNLALLASMGFKREESLEALCCTDNKGIEGALEMLFMSDHAVRRRRREDAVEKYNRQRPLLNGSANGNSNSNGTAPANGSTADTVDVPTLQLTLAALRKQLDNEHNLRLKTEAEKKELVPKVMYKEYVRGLVTEEMEQVKQYRERNKITTADHAETLKEIGVSLTRFDGLKRFEGKAAAECVICLDKPKDHILTPCMHLCICHDCVPNLQKQGKCPMCTKKIQQILRIYL
jgi:hypothetical protein